MKLLVFSDIHSDTHAAANLVEMSAAVDVVVGAGDYCIARRGLDDIIQALKRITKPTLLVPGNSESEEELETACQSWETATALHGGLKVINGVTFYGIGGGIPVTPFGSWSYDFTEDQALELLRDCPSGSVLISHSPPKGILDLSSDGRRLGSRAVKETIINQKPILVICGHIHGSAGQVAHLGDITIINAGPQGMIWNI
jgi:Icc-related predicted phosphoesterase